MSPKPPDKRQLLSVRSQQRLTHEPTPVSVELSTPRPSWTRLGKTVRAPYPRWVNTYGETRHEQAAEAFWPSQYS